MVMADWGCFAPATGPLHSLLTTLRRVPIFLMIIASYHLHKPVTNTWPTGCNTRVAHSQHVRHFPSTRVREVILLTHTLTHYGTHKHTHKHTERRCCECSEVSVVIPASEDIKCSQAIRLRSKNGKGSGRGQLSRHYPAGGGTAFTLLFFLLLRTLSYFKRKVLFSILPNVLFCSSSASSSWLFLAYSYVCCDKRLCKTCFIKLGPVSVSVCDVCARVLFWVERENGQVWSYFFITFMFRTLINLIQHVTILHPIYPAIETDKNWCANRQVQCSNDSPPGVVC